MNSQDIREAIELFLELFEVENPEDTEGAKLRFALDQVALAQHGVSDVEPRVDAPPPPTPDEEELRQRYASVYPALGESPVALQQLVEVATDLEDVLWRWDRYGESDALWHFRFLFEAHFGGHLRALQLFLHEQRFSDETEGEPRS